jgi:Tol biopolymer transport system component
MLFPLVAAMAVLQTQDSVAREAAPGEVGLRNVRQLTFGGQNAEAYWNLDGSKIVYQARLPQYPDEQIFTMNPDGSGKKLISTGLGRCTCGYFLPDGKSLIYSSTFERDSGPQPPVDMSQGYVWMVNPLFALYRSGLEGGTPEALIKRRGYVAEATIAPDGSYMTFTGGFDGDLDIYRCDLDGRNIQRLTWDYGYDGGPFVSWDSRKIVYRRAAIRTPKEREDYKRLLKLNLVRPGKLEIWVMNADGSGKRQVTNLQLKPRRPEGARVRPVYDRSQRQEPEARDPKSGVRRFPNVHARRQEAYLGVESPRLGARGDEHLRGRLGRLEARGIARGVAGRATAIAVRPAVDVLCVGLDARGRAHARRLGAICRGRRR